MPDTADLPAGRYSAFVSYSRADAPFARRLHRQLEGYRLPGAVAAASHLRGRRLKPLFRDRDELTAASDLSDAVREALAQSDNLIVVCSPAAAESKWVAWEIEVFRKQHGDRRILTALVAGDSQTSFPPPLRRRRGHGQQPLAADFRPRGDGARMALLKLVAPLAGARLDDLVHRDGQRRMRQVAVGLGGALAATVVVALLGVAAISARLDAATQRSRTNGLSQFMLDDLRKGLKAAGRSDLLTEVDRAALQAYPGEHLDQLTPEQLTERAKAQHALGEDSEKRGDLTTARAQFEAAWRATATLLAAKPSDPKRIFTHAQSEYWVGFIDWREGEGATARKHLEAYARLADRLVAIEPTNNDYVMETVYAANNLGTLALRHDGDPMRAERHFRAALVDIDQIASRKPGDHDVMSEKSDALAWLADSQRLQGHLDQAAVTRDVQGRILRDLLARDPRNVEDRADLLSHDLAVARIETARGQYARAAEQLEAGRNTALALAAQDPDNKSFPRQARMFELFKVRNWLSMPAGARPPLATLEHALGDCAPTGPGPTAQEISDFCSVLLARTRASRGDKSGARAALASLQHTETAHDILTARWGLNLDDEAKSIRMQ